MGQDPEHTASEEERHMVPHDMDDVADRIGTRIRGGQVSAEVGHQAIGAVAAWRAGFPDLALADMGDALVAAVEQELRAAGVPIPWPPHTSGGPPPESPAD